MLQAALDYLALGFAVFPLIPNEKKPLASLVAHGVKDASKDPNQVRIWWRQSPRANIGVACGESAQIICVDLDDGATEEDLKLFPRTWTTKTRDGYHLYFKFPPGGIRNGDGFDLSGATGKATTAKANVRSTGLYVVGVGSDVEGHEYHWHCDPGGELKPQECPLANVPAWLLGAMSLKPQLVVQPTSTEFTQKVSSDAAALVTKGSRHCKLTAMAVAARKKNKTKEVAIAELVLFNLKKCVPPKELPELEKLVAWAYATVEPLPDAPLPPPKSESPADLREAFLEDMQYKENEVYSIRYHRQVFYRHDGHKYVSLDQVEIEDVINRWLMSQPARRHMAGRGIVRSIQEVIRIKPVLIHSSLNSPALLLDGEWQCGKHLIPFQNGLFDIREYATSGNVTLKPHTPDFFCTYVLPFDFDAQAQCPTFEAIANTTFDCSEKRALWEEVMGVHLYQPFLLEHFFILQGEGSNGKGVLLAILKALLGRENVCSVPLENFHSSNFSFHETYGKLANIVSDQHDVDDINEGMLKQFVSRELITFNRKFKDPITAKPTCFVTIATNALPKFTDKSDGVWRRMVLFKFEKQIAEEKRNPDYVSDNFWLRSGELAGIFNLALSGLVRVIKRGHLAKVASLEADKLSVKTQSDNIAGFIDDCVEPSANIMVSSQDVYATYVLYAQQHGTRSVASNKFHGRLQVEFQKRGIDAERPQKKYRIEDSVGFVWQRLQLTPFGCQTLGRKAIVCSLK